MLRAVSVSVFHSKGWAWWAAGLVLLPALAFTLLAGGSQERRDLQDRLFHRGIP